MVFEYRGEQGIPKYGLECRLQPSTDQFPQCGGCFPRKKNPKEFLLSPNVNWEAVIPWELTSVQISAHNACPPTPTTTKPRALCVINAASWFIPSKKNYFPTSWSLLTSVLLSPSILSSVPFRPLSPALRWTCALSWSSSMRVGRPAIVLLAAPGSGRRLCSWVSWVLGIGTLSSS